MSFVDEIDDVQDRVEAMVSRGASLEDIEEAILTSLDWTEEQRSAMWLFAWSMMSRKRARRETRLMLQDLALRKALAEDDGAVATASPPPDSNR